MKSQAHPTLEGHIGYAVVAGDVVIASAHLESQRPVAISKANARLIAAAPDLLAACRAALDLFADLLTSAESKSQADAMRHCQALVRAAIAKAEGGQP